MIDFSNVTDIMIGNTPVEQIEDSHGNVLWGSAVDPSTVYFYVEDVSGSNNTLSITKNNSSAPYIEVFYSTDQQNWTSMGTTDTTPITATVPANGKLYLKATANAWSSSGNSTPSNTINTSGNCNVGGNIMSLLYGDNFTGQTTFPAGSTYNFNLLFNGLKVVNANNLILPATTLVSRCYSDMFKNCTNLVTIPALPATTLAVNCYNCMFDVCTSLTTVPTDLLPVTTIADSCYRGMFRNCSSLTTAPTLPATTLDNGCYNQMFSGCSSLTTAPVLPATTLTSNCYREMFSGCSSLTTAPTLPATTLGNSCYYKMFSGCSSLTTAPATLPATTLLESCYREMFSGCSSLTTAPVLPATTMASRCYDRMFMNCAALNTITTYAQDVSLSGCLTDWVYNVAAQGDFYNLGGATYTSGRSGIPTGWTEHNSL